MIRAYRDASVYTEILVVLLFSVHMRNAKEGFRFVYPWWLSGAVRAATGDWIFSCPNYWVHTEFSYGGNGFQPELSYCFFNFFLDPC